jgi:hypothetical protein
MKLILGLILLAALASGCESIPIKDGELAVGKDTTVGVEDMGIGKVASKF